MMGTSEKHNVPHGLLKWTCYVVLAVGGCLFLWLTFAYLCEMLLPFLLAWLLSRLIRPWVDRLTKYRRIPRGPVAALLVGVLVLTVVGALWWGIDRGLRELGILMENLANGEGEIFGFFSDVQDILNSVTSHIPFLRGLAENPDFSAFCQRLDEMVRQGAEQGLVSLGQALPAVAMGVVKGMPSVLIFATSLLFSC